MQSRLSNDLARIEIMGRNNLITSAQERSVDQILAARVVQQAHQRQPPRHQSLLRKEPRGQGTMVHYRACFGAHHEALRRQPHRPC